MADSLYEINQQIERFRIDLEAVSWATTSWVEYLEALR